MKKTFSVLLVAMSFAATGVSASTAEPMDTVRAYVIDGQVVKNFTGEELVGKTVKSYTILPSTYDNNDGKGFSHVLLLHSITTDKAPVKKADDHPVVYIDGVLSTYESLNDHKPEDIKSIDVIKNSKLLEAYAKQGVSKEKLKNGVIRVTTKKLDADNLVYVVDGQKSTAVAVKKIPSDSIKAINLFKKGSGSKYAEQYGKDVDVVEIITK